MVKALTLTLTLRHIDPVTWRCVSVSDQLNFVDLHCLIQILFGWTGMHLFEFRSKLFVIGEQSSLHLNLRNQEKINTPDSIKLMDVFKKERDHILYTYDFGDNWEIDIIVDKVETLLQLSPQITYKGGEGAGPIEDVGGPPMFMEMKRAYLNPLDPEHPHVKANWDQVSYHPELLSEEVIVKAIEQFNGLVEGNEREMMNIFNIFDDGMEDQQQESTHEHFKQLMEESGIDVVPDLKLNYQAFYELITNPFSSNSPLPINWSLPLFSLKQSPFFNLALKLLTKIGNEGKLKATAKGNLPLKVVKELFHPEIIPRVATYPNPKTIESETDYEELFTMRTVAKQAGLLKKQKGNFSLTKKGEKLIQEKYAPQLFKLLLETYCEKFNWAYWDGFEDEYFGQLGIGLILLWLKKYGGDEKKSLFYIDKYIEAFPQYQDPDFQIVNTPDGTSEIDDSYQKILMESAFYIRVCERGLANWGLVHVRREGRIPEEKTFMKGTVLLSQLVS